jgi:hypothetical protein
MGYGGEICEQDDQDKMNHFFEQTTETNRLHE